MGIEATEEFVNPSEMTESDLQKIDDLEIEPTEQTSEEQEIVQEDSWKPEYKVKVLDKEYEIDEFIRPVVTKENYTKVKELYEKAYGLDSVKSKYQKVNEELDSYRPYMKDAPKNAEILNYMGSLINKKDYRTLVSELQMPDEALMEIALERAKRREMAPEERQAYDSNLQERQRLYALEMQNQKYEQMFQQGAVQERTSELDNYLASDNVKAIAQMYDDQVGKSGAFRNKVIESGQFAAKNLGRDLPVQEAVQAVIFNEKLYTQGTPTLAQGNAPKVAVTTQSKPVIPNIRAGGSNPTGKLLKSTDELRKLSAQMASE